MLDYLAHAMCYHHHPLPQHQPIDIHLFTTSLTDHLLPHLLANSGLVPALIVNSLESLYNNLYTFQPIILNYPFPFRTSHAPALYPSSSYSSELYSHRVVLESYRRIIPNSRGHCRGMTRLVNFKGSGVLSRGKYRAARRRAPGEVDVYPTILRRV